MAHVVVVGAGQAGSAVVAKLRGLGFDGQITLIGEEPAPPYQRPPLSKAYLMGEMEEERLWLRSNAFYAEQNITLRLSAKVGGIDRAAKTLTVGDETLSYDHLVLTTGSTPRRLPTAKEYARTGDASIIWEGHKAGRIRPYYQIEKLTNLAAIPATGFTFSCFPVKIERASAGWIRAVALIAD